MFAFIWQNPALCGAETVQTALLSPFPKKPTRIHQ